MKLNFNLKNKEANFEADIEKIVDKNIEYRHERQKNTQPKKTRYQIKQEEKRKNQELEFKHNMQIIKILGIALIFLFVFIGIMAYLEKN